MKVTVEKLTDPTLMQEACEFTMHGAKSNMTLEKIYKCRHSPMRTQMFVVRMYDIPTFVSVHLVRHKIGCEHYVTSNRDDRGGSKEEDRYTPVNHMMLVNAESLITLAHKRLCLKTHVLTRKVMELICLAVGDVDEDLLVHLTPLCVYRSGVCQELKCCSLGPTKMRELYE